MTAIVDAINKRCNRGFIKEFIDLGEFSCQATENTAVYRQEPGTDPGFSDGGFLLRAHEVRRKIFGDHAHFN